MLGRVLHFCVVRVAKIYRETKATWLDCLGHSHRGADTDEECTSKAMHSNVALAVGRHNFKRVLLSVTGEVREGMVVSDALTPVGTGDTKI